MESLRIDIVNPKAKRLLNDLADLNLIRIQKSNPIKSFDALLDKLRGKEPISLDEITKEVEAVRTKRYAKKH